MLSSPHSPARWRSWRGPLAQLRERLSDTQTQALVADAEAAGDTVVLVDIDPREGSGVIPVEWEAFLQPRREGAASGSSARGASRPSLRDVKALGGVLRRNYDYDRFWLVFPLVTERGDPLFAPTDSEAEIVVRIHDQEGRVRFAIPASVRQRMAAAGTSR